MPPFLMGAPFPTRLTSVEPAARQGKTNFSSSTLTFDMPVVAGNVIVVFRQQADDNSNVGSISVTDNLGTLYTSAIQVTSGVELYGKVLYGVAAGSGTCTLTVTGGVANYDRITAGEFENMVATSPSSALSERGPTGTVSGMSPNQVWTGSVLNTIPSGKHIMISFCAGYRNSMQFGADNDWERVVWGNGSCASALMSKVFNGPANEPFKYKNNLVQDPPLETLYCMLVF